MRRASRSMRALRRVLRVSCPHATHEQHGSRHAPGRCWSTVVRRASVAMPRVRLRGKRRAENVHRLAPGEVLETIHTSVQGLLLQEIVRFSHMCLERLPS